LNLSLKNISPQLSLSVLWIICAIIVNPIGNFPLNDDWAYAKNVFYLSEQGILKYSDWPAMTLISQMLWGAAFCKVFGFSFTILRISVIILGLIGTNLIFVLTNRISNSQKTAIIATLVLCYNPLYFSLSYTFMTEIPFLVAVLFAFYFYIQHLFNPTQKRYLIAATIFSIIATLTRQTGLILPIVFLIGTFILNRKFDRNLVFHIISAIIVASILYFYVKWLKASGNLSSNFSTVNELFRKTNIRDLMYKLWKRSCVLLFYNGLFLLPFSIYIFKSYWINTSFRQKLLLIPLSTLISIPVIFIWEYIPVSNILNSYGVGPKVLKDYYWEINIRHSLPQFGWTIINISATIGSSLIIFYLLSGLINFIRQRGNNENRFFNNIIGNKTLFNLKFISFGIIAAYWTFLLLGIFFFDRYYLFFLPFLILLFVPAKCINSKVASYSAFCLLIVYMFFSISSTHDYLSWNKIRWKALNSLTDAGISPNKIDGGFEFNGWYETNKRNPDEQFGKSWWFVKDDVYLVAFGDFCGFRKVKKYIYHNYLTFDEDSIFILKRIENERKDTITIFCDAENIKYIDGKEMMPTTDSSFYCEVKKARTDAEAYSGKYSVKLDEQSPYGFTINLKGITTCETIVISAYTKYNTGNASIVASTPGGQGLYIYKTVSDTTNADTWKYIEMEVRLPQNLPQELGFCVWNNTKQTVLFDDFKIQRIITGMH
jgi:4-amino-4-deoxy-L-arabinose transferase-like glycosyltransferase